MPLTICFGIAAYPADGETAGALLRAGDAALYGAKAGGRNRSVIHSLALRELVTRSGVGVDIDGERYIGVVRDLAEALDLRFSGSARHSETVGRYAEMMAVELGIPQERVARVRLAGILHDIGKVAVPDAILHKPGKPTEEEWATIRRHPELGAQILEHPSLADVRRWVAAHHERPDGKGYPLGLSGTAIPVEARILAVADAYEAMTSDRSYRASIGHEAARAELQRFAGSQFDPAVVEGAQDGRGPRIGARWHAGASARRARRRARAHPRGELEEATREGDPEVVRSVGAPAVDVGAATQLPGPVTQQLVEEVRVAGGPPGGFVAARQQRRCHREGEQAAGLQQPQRAVQYVGRCMPWPKGGERDHRGEAVGGQLRDLLSRPGAQVADPEVVVDARVVATGGLARPGLEVQPHQVADAQRAQLDAAEAVARAEIQHPLLGRGQPQVLERPPDQTDHLGARAHPQLRVEDALVEARHRVERRVVVEGHAPPRARRPELDPLLPVGREDDRPQLVARGHGPALPHCPPDLRSTPCAGWWTA